MREQGRMSAGAMVEGAQRAMRISLTRETENLENHLSFLATVGSTSPYIGLFGTVWGIMTSFHQLANVNQATIAMVAPGISEALIATAMGLFAAIPAVIGLQPVQQPGRTPRSALRQLQGRVLQHPRARGAPDCRLDHGRFSPKEDAAQWPRSMWFPTLTSCWCCW